MKTVLRLLSELLRRALWLIPTLVLVTAIAFAVTANALTASEQPIFFNTRPLSVADRAWALAERVGASEDGARDAARELTLLGGAALPHILPKLDSLPPIARERLTQALGPLAQRMGLADDQPTGERALSLWSSFWMDHFVDFHPAMVRRVVQRYAEEPTAPRAREVRRLDTYALSELIEHLESMLVGFPEKRDNLVEVTRLLEHIAPGDAPAAMDVEVSAQAARASVRAWQRWWNRERHVFESPVGLERVLAPVLQTQYAAWARNAADTWFRGGVAGLFAAFPWSRFARSLTLFLTALVGGGIWGSGVGAWGSTLAPAWLRRIESFAGLVWLAIPPAALSALVAVTFGPTFALASVVALFTGAAIAARYESSHAQMSLRVTQRRDPDAPRRQGFVHLWRSSAPTAVWALCTHASSMLATVIVVEAAFQIEGLGVLAVRALREGNIEAVLLTAVLTTTFVSLVPALGRILSRLIDPQLRSRTSEGTSG